MTSRRLARPAALLAAAIIGAVVVVSLHGGASAPAPPAAPVLSTATLVRTDLHTSVLTTGTLGFAPADPVMNQLSGTYTQLPAVGATITPGRALYRVNNVPAVLMTGATPAWRPMQLGMTGPDVAELQSNLIAFGDVEGLLTTTTGVFDWLTVNAVERWQIAEHEPVTGVVALGAVVFLPTRVRVGAVNVTLAQAAVPGQEPYRATTTSLTVTVPLNPNLPAARIGERVPITLPSGTTIPGRITGIGPVPPRTRPSFAGSGGDQASTQLTVTPDRAAGTTSIDVAVQVSLTTSSVRGTLAAPVSALLALAGGGYGVETIEPSGAHRLVAVRTGVFAGSQVQVAGTGIQPGTKVVIAQ